MIKQNESVKSRWRHVTGFRSFTSYKMPMLKPGTSRKDMIAVTYADIINRLCKTYIVGIHKCLVSNSIGSMLN